MFPIKRKFLSATWRLKQATVKGFNATTRYLIDGITEKYWLLDYLPTFWKKKDGVLLIRLDLIGDFVLWLDSAQAYRGLYPDQRITLLVNSACRDLALTLPHWDEVIGVNVGAFRTNAVYRFITLTKLRWRNFKTAVQPTFSREFAGDLALRSTHAIARLGYEGDTNNIPSSLKVKTDLWYTMLVTNDRTKTMELNINAHFIREIGGKNFLSRLPLIPQACELPAPLQFNEPYIVIAPGASWVHKMWPIQNFTQLIEQLVSTFKLKIVLCGGSDDRQVCDQLAKLVSSVQVTDLSGKTTLPELVEMIRGARLLITNDSSPVHIAAATATDSVCILGGGHFGRFLPYQIETETSSPFPTILKYEMDCYGCGWRCVYPLERQQATQCIANVNVALVYEACLQNLLSGEEFQR